MLLCPDHLATVFSFGFTTDPSETSQSTSLAFLVNNIAMLGTSGNDLVVNDHKTGCTDTLLTEDAVFGLWGVCISLRQDNSVACR